MGGDPADRPGFVLRLTGSPATQLFPQVPAWGLQAFVPELFPLRIFVGIEAIAVPLVIDVVFIAWCLNTFT